MEEQPEGIINESGEPFEGFAPQLQAENLSFGPGFLVGASVGQDMTMSNAGAFAIDVGRDMELMSGGATAITVGHDLEMENGGAMVLVVGGNTEVTNGGSIVTVAGNQVTAQNSFFGVLISQQTTLEAGSKVLLDTKQAFTFGAVFGIVFALLSWLLRRK